MRHPIVQYTLWLFIIALFHGGILWGIDVSLAPLYFWESYALNVGLTVLFLWGLLAAFNRLSYYVAWIFMAASALKFLLFFILLWPLFKSDGTISIYEKTTFLTPYLSSLILETRILIAKLNKI